MLRELKSLKVKKDESLVVLADEGKLNKRNQKVEEKEAAKKTPSDEEDLMRKWRSAPNNSV
jgi:hypothetical protein